MDSHKARALYILLGIKYNNGINLKNKRQCVRLKQQRYNSVMKKPVIISIKGAQNTEDGNEEIMELVTQGVLSGEEGDYSLTYPESELTGLEGTITTFHIEKDRITLLREGALNSQMVFREGEKHFSLYETPYGGLMLGVKTHKARSSIGQSGGALEIRYGLEIDNEDIGENFFNIKVTEPGQALPSMNA